jgi:hypothetical protein
LEAIGLSVEDLSRMFHVTVRSAKSWTNGGTRVPTWLMPSLQIYRLLSPTARRAVLESLTQDGLPGRGGRPAANQSRANAVRHPFARIEEL